MVTNVPGQAHMKRHMVQTQITPSVKFLVGIVLMIFADIHVEQILRAHACAKVSNRFRKG